MQELRVVLDFVKKYYHLRYFINIDKNLIFIFFSEKSEKQQKREAKKADKAAKKAAHKTEAGSVSNVDTGAADNEPDHSAGKYGVREMIQSREKLDIKLLNVEGLSAKLKDQVSML